jgi:hypothetical protein
MQRERQHHTAVSAGKPGKVPPSIQRAPGHVLALDFERNISQRDFEFVGLRIGATGKRHGVTANLDSRHDVESRFRQTIGLNSIFQLGKRTLGDEVGANRLELITVILQVILSNNDCPNTQVAFDAQFAKTMTIIADPSGNQLYVAGEFTLFLRIHISSSLATD